METYPTVTKGLVIGIVLLFVGLCSIAVTAQKNGEFSQIPLSGSSQIWLVKKHLPMLTSALKTLNNSFYKTTLQHIRRIIESQGSFDANDVQTITRTPGNTNLLFYSGCMTARGETGFTAVWPFTIFSLFISKHLNFYAGPIVIGLWFTDWQSSDHNWEGVCFSINGQEVIKGATSGIALGGFGCFYRMSFEKPEFDFVGYFTLIIVNNNTS